MSIKLVRLISGEEIIADVTVSNTDEFSSGADSYKLNRPAIVIIQPARNDKNQMGISLIGWIPYSDVAKTGVVIDRDKILFMVDVETSLLKNYEREFSAAGLTAVKSSLIMPSQFAPKG